MRQCALLCNMPFGRWYVRWCKRRQSFLFWKEGISILYVHCVGGKKWLLITSTGKRILLKIGKLCLPLVLYLHFKRDQEKSAPTFDGCFHWFHVRRKMWECMGLHKQKGTGNQKPYGQVSAERRGNPLSLNMIKSHDSQTAQTTQTKPLTQGSVLPIIRLTVSCFCTFLSQTWGYFQWDGYLPLRILESVALKEREKLWNTPNYADESSTVAWAWLCYLVLSSILPLDIERGQWIHNISVIRINQIDEYLADT